MLMLKILRVYKNWEKLKNVKDSCDDDSHHLRTWMEFAAFEDVKINK